MKDKLKPAPKGKEKAKKFTDLTGKEKAAILMLSLPEDQTSKIFAALEVNEIRELSRAMVELGTIDAEVVERTYVDFINQITSTGSLVGSLESTERLLAKLLPPEQLGLIMEDVRGPSGKTIWDQIKHVNDDVLAKYLKNEYPQTIAVVLSRINPESAAKIISLLPENLAIDTILRMLKMDVVRSEIIQDLEKTLRTEFMSNLSRTSKRDQYEMVADIFNFFDRASEVRFLQGLEVQNAESAERVKSLMFTFDDLGELEATAVQALLRSVDKSKLALALKGATDQIKSLFLSNMTERASKLLQEEIKMLGAIRLRDAEEAQNFVVSVAKDLEEKGEIQLKIKSGEDDQLIE